ncbi:MAG: glycosyltransferase family 2 protein [Endomicrobiales bacterium]|nr:glycosyltransferase family 2 protein [Endomicrobiales bacterium]
MKLITVFTPCYNEEENIAELYEKVKEVITAIGKYSYEHIFIDNSSTDETLGILREIAKKDRNVKVIVNANNYGWIRSPFHGMLQGKGDAVICMSADLQDPPEVIGEFIKKWEEGYSIVAGVKAKTRENMLVAAARKIYYKMISQLSAINQIDNFTGFGLYDKSFIEVLKKLEEPYPYFRGLVSELGIILGKNWATI